MLMPLLLAAALQATAPAPQMPAQPARPDQSPAPATQPTMPGTQPAPADGPLPRASATPPPAAEAAQPSPRPDPAALPVDAQFARYDADGDGALDKSEYGSWLAALRTAKEADFKADALESRQWIESSFAAADADRDQKVSREELRSFLTPKAG